MNIFKAILSNHPSFNEINFNLKNGNIPSLVVGLSHIHKAHFSFCINKFYKTPTLIIVEEEAIARRFCDDINNMAQKDVALMFPFKDFSLMDIDASSKEYEQIRLGVLSKICNSSAKIVVASIDSVLQRTIPKDKIIENSFEISLNKSYDIKEIVKNLIRAGYVKRAQVEGIAQFSTRGGILDIFPPSSDNPIRIEFWDDEIDSITYFEIDTQRRTTSIEKVNITPACEVLFDSNEQLKSKIENLKNSLKDNTKNNTISNILQQDIQRVETGIDINLDKYMPLAYEKSGCLLDYFEKFNIIVSEYGNIKQRGKNFEWQSQQDVKDMFEKGELCSGLDNYIFEFSEISSKLDKHKTLYFDTFSKNYSDLKIKSIINLNPSQTSGWNGDLNLLCEDLGYLLENNYSCVVLAGGEKAAKILTTDLQNAKINAIYTNSIKELSPKTVYVSTGNISTGFDYPKVKTALITTTKHTNPISKKIKKRKAEEIKSLSDIDNGDLVVHISHGIGIFSGINKMEVQGVIKDYIKIKYSGADILYVPVTQLDLVSKYIGPKNDSKVKLNKLNSGEWQKTRARVKKAVSYMADELIKLYAQRAKAKGYAFSDDTQWQREFEQHFEYEETQDQLNSTEEIKQDMEKSSPMDRLLCGDVGFGKTEVALRAAFKCVMDGKQCAILCPTTILAWQHYQNTVSRMSNFPIKIELLSRFRTPKHQKEIIKKLKTGEVDIVIGTHRIVQKDIEFKDLGFAIIDEEQRFGVSHKEKFKQMFSGIDMLTLSATPIPRTLNMAMSGIRDMSVLEQPPQNRHPVQSYVIEHDMGIIGDAIKRELRRDGQVYYIHNRIETIDLCVSNIMAVVPEAKVAVAHGKLNERELSKVWQSLIEKEINVLVCTTLIETGVDVANCNTLIIENADNMGLSQLYQLRGRVGRSSRRAFAYFTFKANKSLTEIATKRLSAIEEFTKFGSGFRIALRDLEIRGAGSILGARQHGHMEDVGYDMYLKLLSEAVSEKKGEKVSNESHECLIDVITNAHIPEKYIDNLQQRIDVYRKIASIKSYQDSLDVTDELIDRFGDIPNSVKGLIDVALLRNTAAKYGFKEVTQKGTNILLFTEKLDMEISGILTSNLKGKVLVNASDSPYISVKMDSVKKPVQTLSKVLQILENNKKD